MRFDVSWVDLLAERRGQGTIWTPVARPEAFGAGFRPFLHGVDATITRRGVMVRLNGVEEAYTLDFDGQKTGPIAFASWPSVPLDRVESAIDDGRPRAVALHLGKSGSVRTVSVAEPTDGVRVDKGVAPPSSPSRDVTTHWSRYGGRPGVVVHLLQPDRGRGVAYFTEVAATSEPARTMPVPTQHDLHEPYRPCTEEIIASSPRVIAPFFAGSRHPVVIDGDVEPMMTSDAVLYGTVESPCLLGWVADGARPGTTRAFIPADRGTGWLLRISRDRKAGVDAIPLQCASAGAGEPPDWIENFAATESVE